jgi:hypothetical protein
MGTSVNLPNVEARKEKYSYKVPKQEALLMALQGAPRPEIAKKYGVSSSAITQLLGKDLENIAGYIAFKKAPDVWYEWNEFRITSNLTDEDIKKMSGYQKAGSAALMRQTIRLMRGESTENHAVIHSDIADLKGKVYPEKGLKSKPRRGAALLSNDLRSLQGLTHDR